MSASLVGYTDESGNTGNHLFDSSQPYYWTGTLLTREEFADSATEFCENWCDTFGLAELHGNELGIPRIERLAKDLNSLIESEDLQFVITVLEKSHLANTKFVDTFFDCGINEAVSPFHYNLRVLRLHITCVVSKLMDRTELERFWNAYRNGDSVEFRTTLGNLVHRVRAFVLDERTKQVLLDALDWAHIHPERLIWPPATELDSPNAVSVALLIGALQEEYEETGRRVSRLVHDDTSQFALAVKATFEFYRRFASLNNIYKEFGSGEIGLDTVKFPVDMRSSSSTAGLQIVDIILWTVKRYLTDVSSGFPACDQLVSEVSSRSRIKAFTQDELEAEATLLWKELFDEEVTESGLRRGYEASKLLEERRVDRMSRSIDDTFTEPTLSRKRSAKAIRQLLRNFVRSVDE